MSFRHHKHMKKLICLVLAGCLMCAVLCACTGNNNGATADESTATPDETVDESVEVYGIETKYCTLKYPKKWEGKVTVTIVDTDGYTVKFARGEDPLFDLLFNSDRGDVLGTIRGNENTVVSVINYDADPKSKDYKLLTEMHGGLDAILDHLSQDYDFAPGEAL